MLSAVSAASLQKEKIMRKVSALTILGIVLCVLALWLSGCNFFTQPGETTAEGHRRHLRNFSVSRQNMMDDIDRGVLFLDEPSKATDIRIPPEIEK